MTNPDAIVEIDTLIKAWQIDEITALREANQADARDARVCIAALQYLREQIVAKAAA